jgi:hypothetical protein
MLLNVGSEAVYSKVPRDFPQYFLTNFGIKMLKLSHYTPRRRLGGEQV